MKQILSKSVVLIGLMGAGKSSIGSELSKSLGVLFSDSDKKIESLCDKSIIEIFNESGEAYFRRLEEKVFCNLLEVDPHIISSGGGTILSKTTRRTISESAYSIWLKSSEKTILNRIKKAKDRPLIAKGDIGKILNEKLLERKKFYNMANFHINNENVSIESVVNQITEKLINEKVLIRS